MAYHVLIANVAIAISAVGYGATFLDANLSPFTTAMWTIATLWLATVLNFGGASITGRVSSFTVWEISSHLKNVAPISYCRNCNRYVSN